MWEAEFERAVGETFERRSDYSQARPQYQKALAIRLAIGPDAAATNREEIARLYGGIGLQSYYLRDDQAAETFLRKSIEAYGALGNRRQQAVNLSLLGTTQGNAGRFDDAAKSVREALAIYEDVKDHAHVAESLARLANISFRGGDYRKALEWAFRALDLHRTLDTPEPRRMADLLENLGNIFWAIRQFDKALEYHRQCLELRLTIGERRALASTYSNIGLILSSNGNFDGALAEYAKALVIRRELNNPADLAVSLNNIGSVQMSLRKTAEARENLRESLALCEKHGYARESAPPLNSLGDIWRLEGDLKQALDYHGRALQARERSGDRLGVVTSLIEVAEDLEMQQDLPGAEKRLEQAVKAWETLSQQVSDPTQLGTFRSAVGSLYPRYARLAMKRGRPNDAFRIAELARGAGLARMARLSTSDFIDLLDPEDRAKWLGAAERLGRAANRLRIVEQQPGGSGTRAAVDASAAFVEADRELTRLRDRLFATNPRLAPANSDGGTSAAEIVSFAKLHPDTMFAEWMMVDDSTTLLFSVSADTGLRAFELPAGRAAIGTGVQNWHNAIGRRKGRGFATKTQTADAEAEPRLARELYQQAFGALIPLLESGGYRRLVLVPDGGLLRVPFAALLDGQGKRLIENYEISSNVSFRGLLRPASPSSARRPLYAVGDPMAPNEERLVVPFGFRFAGLEHAREEALSLGKLFPGGKVVTGPEAREAEVKKNIGQAAILHFATHGILVASDGLRSGLLMASEAEDSAEDGLLQAWEISGLALSARLAVLSACDTGQGDEQQGEGAMGLAWAFQAAGCPNIVASLWSVDDAATRDLMLSFYGHLKTGQAIDGALRHAMIETSGKPGFASPYFWAAFQLIGRGGSTR